MTDDPDGGTELARRFAELAWLMRSSEELSDTLETICRLATDAVPRCHHAGLTWVSDGEVSSPAATDEVPRRADRIQYDVGEGPCLESIREHESFLVADLAHDPRWPRFGPRAAAEAGVHALLSFRLHAGERTLGALNLYSTEADAFGEHDRTVGAIYAAHAGVALAAVREQTQLREAMESNREIGKAVGILMVRHAVSDEAAFALLTEAASRGHRKLREVAAEVVASAR